MSIATRLVKKGFTKYRIARHCGVHWNTVTRWVEKIHAPKQEHVRLMEELEKKNPKDFPANNRLRNQ